jgi:hypothetical protein
MIGPQTMTHKPEIPASKFFSGSEQYTNRMITAYPYDTDPKM